MSLSESAPIPGHALPVEQRRFAALLGELVPGAFGTTDHRIKPPVEFSGVRPYDHVGATILRVANGHTALQYSLDLFAAFEAHPAYRNRHRGPKDGRALKPIHFQTLSLNIDDELQEPGVFRLATADGQVYDDYQNPTHVNNLVTDIRMQRNRMELIIPTPISLPTVD